MFRRILTMIAKDLRTSTRDQLALYILLSPFLLGLMMRLVMPIFEDARPTFVVTEALAQTERDALAAHGELEVVPDRAALERRVLARDDATGVLPGDSGSVEIVIQGDEPEPLRTLARTLIDHADTLASLPAPTPEGPSELRLMAAALLGFCVPALMALVLGFSILEEKTSKTHLIYDVSPLRFGEYLTAKLGLLAVISVLVVIPSVGIPLGFDRNWPAVLAMVLAALPFAACYGLLIGVFASDQLGAIGLVKALSPVWTSLPILGFVLPGAWLWTQWPFANHWAVQGLFHALGDGTELASHLGLTLVTGLPVFVVTAWLLRRRLGFAAHA